MIGYLLHSREFSMLAWVGVQCTMEWGLPGDGDPVEAAVENRRLRGQPSCAQPVSSWSGMDDALLEFGTFCGKTDPEEVESENPENIIMVISFKVQWRGGRTWEKSYSEREIKYQTHSSSTCQILQILMKNNSYASFGWMNCFITHPLYFTNARVKIQEEVGSSYLIQLYPVSPNRQELVSFN